MGAALTRPKPFKSIKTVPEAFYGWNDWNNLNDWNFRLSILFADLILIANDDGDEFFRLEIALGDP